MKKVITLLGLAVSPLLMNAQQFQVAHDTAFLYTAGNDEEFVTVYNTMENITTETYDYSWRFLNSADLPAGWEFQGFCDIVTCRLAGAPFYWEAGNAVSGLPFPGRATSDLKLQLIVPTAGPASSVMLQLEVKSPLQTDTVYYFVSKHAASVQSIAIDDARFQLYPNPVIGNELNILSNAELGVEAVKVYNFFGQEVLNFNMNGKEKNSVQISALPSGIYILQAFDKNNQNIVNRKFSKN